MSVGSALQWVGIIGGAFLLYQLLPTMEERCDEASPDCPENHFSASYLEARHKFRRRVAEAGGSSQAHVIARDESIGEDLTTDVAFFPGTNPEKLIIHMCGTHGVEGFVGSAIQARLLRDIKDGKHDGPSVLFIHAVNPFGFHHHRRFNENNVDINRNWLLTDETQRKAFTREPNAHGYVTLAGLLNPYLTKWWEFYTTVSLKVAAHIPLASKVRVAVVAGQYHDPKGLYFGGQKMERSTEVLRDIVKAHTAGVTRVVCLDVHSGLGPAGEDTLMVDNGEEAAAARSILAPEAGRVQDPTAGGVSAGYDATMGTVNTLDVFPKGTGGVHVTQEFGTVPGAFVVWALIFENAVYHHTPRNSRAREFGSKKLTDVFFVETHEWKKRTLQRGVEVFRSAVKGL